MDLTGISEPLTKLIEVTSAGLGVYHRPRSIRNEADAKAYAIKVVSGAETAADAEKIAAIGLANAVNKVVAADVDMDILERAKARLVHREVQRQINVEAIAEAAILQLPNEVSTDPVDDHWRTRFF